MEFVLLTNVIMERSTFIIIALIVVGETPTTGFKLRNFLCRNYNGMRSINQCNNGTYRARQGFIPPPHLPVFLKCWLHKLVLG
jgi:hypothetical protein